MASLNAEQRKVLRKIKAVARQRGAPYKHVKAAVETGLVESNLRNVNYGDADSLGWRQERASLYKNPLNLTASINRFFDEAQQHDREGIDSGELAARVQRPAEQYRGRYGQRARDAAALLQGPTRPRSPTRSDAAAPDAPPQVDPGARRQLLLAYLAQRGKPTALAELAQGLGSLEPAAQSQPSTAGYRGAPRRRTGQQRLVRAAQQIDQLATRYGVPVTAKQEPGHATGGDHDPTVKGATARDIGGDEASREAMFRDLTRRLGVKGAVYGGADINVIKGGLRYQVISRPHGSGPHLHIGIRRVKRR